jgi:Flp pilus assembly protein TadG
MRSTVPSTRTNFTRRQLQKGQAIVLIALLMLVLFAMLGLAIDSGRAYVDRRDLQAAVDAAALAAGDWYENYSNLNGSTIPNSLKIYQTDVHQYAGASSTTHTSTLVGPNGNLPQDTYTYTYPDNSTLTIVATNTQFNGYEFVFSSVHNLPLAFMQIFGGPTTALITATATSIVGNQRQTPALLTLSTGACALNLKGGAQLTVLGDTYTNGTACIDPNLHEAGNCYGAAGSNCATATYYCYNSTPGFIPYDPATNGGVCKAGDTIGGPVVPAPSLPDPGYLAPSIGYYTSAASYSKYNRGTWTEMSPGSWGGFHLTGGSASCAFLLPGVYQWTAGYQSDATGSLLSNELKSPDEELWSAPGTTSVANPQFWDMNSTNCAGHFNVTTGPAPGFGIKHNGGGGNWGVELTSVRYDTFNDPTITPNPCFNAPGCRRESAPSSCKPVSTLDTSNLGIIVNVTQNAPGAQYYNVYLNPNGCLPYAGGSPNDFSFVGRFDAPGFVNGAATGPYPSGANTLLTAGLLGWPCALGTVTICNIAYNQLSPTKLCFAQTRSQLCQPPDDELAPQCFSNCPPPPGLLSQENAPMSLEYIPYTGGDVANENYCQATPAAGAGDPNAPCATAKITPGAVQFYFPAGSCMTQNAAGATYVFSGEQYNWIVIYQQPGPPVTCSNTLNGGASTQYIGTIYTPSSDWKIAGGNRSPLAGQVIAYTATVTGSSAVGIDFNPNYSPAPPAARLIN